MSTQALVQPTTEAPARALTDHERHIELARMAAVDGCESSARELEDLLDEAENPADLTDLAPLSKLRRMGVLGAVA